MLVKYIGKVDDISSQMLIKSAPKFVVDELFFIYKEIGKAFNFN